MTRRLAALFLFLGSAPLRGADCLPEAEPNGMPRPAADAGRVLRGAGCLEGSLGASDADFTAWVLDAEAATRRYRIHVRGAPRSLVAARVFAVRFGSKGAEEASSIHRVEAGPDRGEGQGDWLWLPEGTYQLGVTGSGAALDYRVTVSAEPAAPGREQEPNASAAKASPLDGATVATLADRRDRDFFTWAAPVEASQRRYRVRLDSPWAAKDPRLTLALVDTDGRSVAEAHARNGGLELGPLALTPGRQGALVQGAAPSAYRLELHDLGPRPPGGELEPNGSRSAASPGRVGALNHGDLAAKDKDWWTFEVPARPARKRWRLRAEHLARGALVLALYRVGERSTHLVSRRARDIDLPSLKLAPGRYLLELRADRPGPYRWTLERQRGRSRPGTEVEPNDDRGQAYPLEEARFARGRLVGEDLDWVRFEVGEPVQRWTVQANGAGVQRLRVVGPDGKDHARVDGAQNRGLRVDELVLLPGTHWIELEGSDADWSLRVLPTGPVPDGYEREPNGTISRSELLRFDEARFGALSRPDDVDLYRVRVESGVGVDLEVSPPHGHSIRAQMFWGLDGSRRVFDETVEGSARRIPAYLHPGEYRVRLSTRAPTMGEYALRLSPVPGRPPPPPGEEGRASAPATPPATSPVSLALSYEGPPPAAYAPAAQELTALLRLGNPSDGPLALTFTGQTAHRLLQVQAPEPRTLAAGASVTTTVGIEVLPGAWADWPVAVWIQARDGAGRVRSTRLEIEPQPDAELVAPRPRRPVPDALRGGLNRAALRAGARLLEVESDRNRKRLATLFDQYVGLGAGALLDWDPEAITIELADGGPVTGFLLHPLAHCRVDGRPREVAIDLSEDGSRFEEVWRGTLTSDPREQAMVLDAPRPARAARLRILSTAGGGSPCLGEFKVVGAPGSGPSERNLLDPRWGGAVVWADPKLPGSWNRSVLIDGPNSRPRSQKLEGDEGAFVVGFLHQRAALLTRLEWHPWKGKGRKGETLAAVDVAVSTESPAGPWRSIGSWDLTGPRDAPAVLEFPAPVWARYVKLSMPDFEGRYFEAPERLDAFEAPQRDGYRTILGEWGLARREGPYEALREAAGGAGWQAPPDSIRIEAGHGTRASAQTLSPTTAPRFHGRVRVGRREDWVRLPVPAGLDELTLVLRADEAVRPRVTLHDARGAALSAEPYPGPLEPGALGYRWKVSGPHVDVHLVEPRRNVVITWDGSGSVGAYRNAIWRSVLRYSAGLDPKEEVAGLLPFGSPGILEPGWAESPAELRAILGRYDHRFNSSDAEGALRLAAQALLEREGRRAIVIITDADCGFSSKLWPPLLEARPQVFSLWASAQGAPHADFPYASQGLLQSWASVNHGRFAPLRSPEGLEHELDRTAHEIRRPVRYRVEGRLRRAAPPRPGRLLVTRGEAARRARRPALGVIFDASGSMYKKLGERTRLDVARAAFVDLVREDLPGEIDVSLRAFGHREERSCRTDLELPLGPLDRDALAAKVQAIDPKAYSKTPIGASLVAMGQDLAKATGPRMVVLLTDGEETCDGDPAAAIESLRSQGVHTRVNIVGLAIDSAETKKTFEEWARLGGGAYFDAADPAGLASAVTQAVRQPFRVLAESGEVVATGLVGGEAVELPPGPYSLETLGESVYRRAIAIPEDETVTVEL